VKFAHHEHHIMSIALRGLAAATSSLILLALTWFATGANAQAPAKPLKEQVVGHWQLVSVLFNGNPSYGADPQGTMFLDAAGHYAVIVITAGQARSVGYYGTYTVNESDSSITLHIEASTGVNSAAGRDQHRAVSFNGDQMIQENIRSDGAKGSMRLTWKRAE
jgi:Lipocalin-like domain